MSKLAPLSGILGLTLPQWEPLGADQYMILPKPFGKMLLEKSVFNPPLSMKTYSPLRPPLHWLIDTQSQGSPFCVCRVCIMGKTHQSSGFTFRIAEHTVRRWGLGSNKSTMYSIVGSAVLGRSVARDHSYFPSSLLSPCLVSPESIQGQWPWWTALLSIGFPSAPLAPSWVLACEKSHPW